MGKYLSGTKVAHLRCRWILLVLGPKWDWKSINLKYLWVRPLSILDGDSDGIFTGEIAYKIAIWGFLKMVGFPNSHGFSTKNDLLGVFGGTTI